MKITFERALEVLEAMGYELEQPEQEPVAWELRAGKTDRVLIEITNNAERAHNWRCSLNEVVPLYAAPVRTKDLTDEEIFKTNKTELPDCQDLVDFARAVIAADRELNKQTKENQE